MGPSKILGGCDVRSQEFVPVQSCHISCQLAMSQSESAYSAIADWHWNTSNTPEVAIWAPYGDVGHHNAEMGTCGRGDMLVRLGPGGPHTRHGADGGTSKSQAQPPARFDLLKPIFIHRLRNGPNGPKGSYPNLPPPLPQKKKQDRSAGPVAPYIHLRFRQEVDYGQYGGAESHCASLALSEQRQITVFCVLLVFVL